MAVITDDRQVMIWEIEGGRKFSEHRSIGDLGYSCRGDTVWVRKPRELDPVYVVCCVPCSRWDSAKAFASGHRRAHVVAEHWSEVEATDLAKLHAEAHRLAVASFEIRRIVVYRRQHRLERELG